MPIEPSRELVLKKLHDCFPDQVAGRDALQVLDTYETDSSHLKHRVQLALLRISAGDLDKLRLYTRGAQSDYRGTLIPAEFYEESQASSNTPPAEMALIRKRDRESYEAWLRSGGTEDTR